MRLVGYGWSDLRYMGLYFASRADHLFSGLRG